MTTPNTPYLREQAARRVKEARVIMSNVLSLVAGNDGAWAEAYRIQELLAAFEQSLREE